MTKTSEERSSLFSFKTCYWLAHSTVCFGRPESLNRVRLKAEKVQQAITNNRKAVSNDQANDDSKDTYDQNTAQLLYDNLLQHDDWYAAFSVSQPWGVQYEHKDCRKCFREVMHTPNNN
ncbi:hypothetical protein WAI453_006812 [Rhynchosporium graminicola]